MEGSQDAYGVDAALVRRAAELADGLAVAAVVEEHPAVRAGRRVELPVGSVAHAVDEALPSVRLYSTYEYM